MSRPLVVDRCTKVVVFAFGCCHVGSSTTANHDSSKVGWLFKIQSKPIGKSMHESILRGGTFHSENEKHHSPEGQGVVSNKGLTLAHQEGAILRSALAIVLQEFFRQLTAVATSAQLSVKPALRAVQLVVVATTFLRRQRDKREQDRRLFRHARLADSSPLWRHLNLLLRQPSGSGTSPPKSKSYDWSGRNNAASKSVCTHIVGAWKTEAVQESVARGDRSRGQRGLGGRGCRSSTSC